MSDTSDSSIRRSCAGCREPIGHDRHVRWFQTPDGDVWPDWTGKSKRVAGRGVRTHGTSSCIHEAFTRGGIARGLRSRVSVSSDLAIQRACEFAEKLFWQRLSLGKRAGEVLVGQTAMISDSKAQTAEVVLIAGDAGASAQRKFRGWAQRRSLVLFGVDSGVLLGSALGLEFVSVVGVARGAFSNDIVQLGQSLVALKSTSLIRIDETRGSGSREGLPVDASDGCDDVASQMTTDLSGVR